VLGSEANFRQEMIDMLLTASAAAIVTMCGLVTLQALGIGSNTLLDNRPVLGRPFEADLEMAVVKAQPGAEPSRVTSSGRVCRDSEGRTRFEAQAEAGTQSVVFITDPAHGAAYLINHKDRTVTDLGTHNPSKGSDLFTGVTPPAGSEIEGLPCVVIRHAADGTSTETWISLDLGEILLEKITGPAEERVKRLYNIKRVEPDPGLFKIPGDYRLVKR
jgi:hypothetical protein